MIRQEYMQVIIGAMSFIVVLCLGACSKAPDISGRYEVLSGRDCGLAVGEGNQIEFDIVPAATGQKQAYQMQLDAATVALLEMHNNSAVALLDENGAISFVYEKQTGLAQGVILKAAVTMSFEPHPIDGNMMLLTRWHVGSPAKIGKTVEVDLLQELAMADGGIQPYRSGRQPALCVGRMNRISAQTRAELVAKAEAEAEAELAALQKQFRAISYSNYIAMVDLCRSASTGHYRCQVAASLWQERREQEYKDQLIQLGKAKVADFDNKYEQCSKNPRLQEEPGCRAALEIQQSRLAAAERERLLALPYNKYLAAYRDCQKLSAHTCEQAQAIRDERDNEEIARLMSLDGPVLQQQKETACDEDAADYVQAICDITSRTASQFTEIGVEP